MNTLTTIVAKYLILLPIICLGYVFLKQDKRGKLKLVAAAAIGGAVSLFLAKLIGHFYYDTRPFIAGHFTPIISGSMDNGFPSDHTMLSSFAAFMVLRYNKHLSIALLLVATAIGVARVHAGVHHPADVVGGILIAGVGVGLGLLASERIMARHKKAANNTAPKI